MIFKTLRTEVKKQVAYCSLNRPEKKNAINKLMLRELLEYFHGFAGVDQTRVLVLRGAGNIFSAGADLSMMSDTKSKDEEVLRKEAELFFDCFDALYRLRIPVICYVSGAVHGGANGLVAASDLVLCDPDTRFSFSEVKLGLIPATVAPFIVRRTGMVNAKKLMLWAEVFDGKEALELGLIDRLCEKTEADESIQRLTNQIIRNAPDAVSLTKKLFQDIEYQFDSTGVKRLCTGLIARARMSGEASEGIDAFFSKRLPNWELDK